MLNVNDVPSDRIHLQGPIGFATYEWNETYMWYSLIDGQIALTTDDLTVSNSRIIISLSDSMMGSFIIYPVLESESNDTMSFNIATLQNTSNVHIGRPNNGFLIIDDSSNSLTYYKSNFAQPLIDLHLNFRI